MVEVREPFCAIKVAVPARATTLLISGAAVKVVGVPIGGSKVPASRGVTDHVTGSVSLPPLADKVAFSPAQTKKASAETLRASLDGLGVSFCSDFSPSAVADAGLTMNVARARTTGETTS